LNGPSQADPLSPLATQAGLPGSEPPVTRSVGVCEPGAIRRHSGSVYSGDGDWKGSIRACRPMFSPIHATVDPSALIEAPGGPCCQPPLAGTGPKLLFLPG